MAFPLLTLGCPDLCIHSTHCRSLSIIRPGGHNLRMWVHNFLMLQLLHVDEITPTCNGHTILPESDPDITSKIVQSLVTTCGRSFGRIQQLHCRTVVCFREQHHLKSIRHHKILTSKSIDPSSAVPWLCSNTIFHSRVPLLSFITNSIEIRGKGYQTDHQNSLNTPESCPPPDRLHDKCSALKHVYRPFKMIPSDYLEENSFHILFCMILE